MKCTPMHSGVARCLSTLSQLREVTRREFIDTATVELVDLQALLECLLLTSDIFVTFHFFLPLKKGEYKAVFTLRLTRFTVAV